MQIKQLEFQPYINNNEPEVLFGEMAYVKDNDNNIIFYYLIIKPQGYYIDDNNYSIMIAGNMHSTKCQTMQAAREYCQKHFEDFFKLNVIKLKEAA